MNRIILIVALVALSTSLSAAEGVLTNFYQYSPFATQGMIVCKFYLPTNLYNITTTRILLSTDNGSTFVEKPRQQVASNYLAVVTDIGADATNQWQVRTNATPASFAGYPYITILTNGGGNSNQLYTVTNGLTGMQVINTNLAVCSNLFPLVAWQLYDRSWCFETSKVYDIGLIASSTYVTNPIPTTNIAIRIVDSGPLIFQVEVTQLYARQGFEYLTVNHPAGTGSNVIFLTMYAHRPIVEISHRTDSQLFYQFDGNSAKATVNQFRYRNCDYNYLSSQFGGRIGYQFGAALADVPNGSNGKDIIMPMLAHVNVDGTGIGINGGESLTNESTTLLGTTRIGEGTQGGAGHFTRGSWYVLEDTNSTSSTVPVYGVGNGPASLALGNPRCTGFAPFYRTNGAIHGFRFQTEHIPSVVTYLWTNSCLNYFLYTGSELMHTNSSDVHYSPMSAEFDKVNYFNLAKQTAWDVASSVGALGSRTNRGTFALPRSYLTNIMQRMRDGEAGLYDSIFANDTVSQDITRALNDATGFYTRVLVTNIITSGQGLFQSHMQGDGSLLVTYNFLQGSQTTGRDVARIEIVEMLSGFDSIDAKLLWQCRFLGLLYSRCLFDQDWYPIDNILAGIFNGSLGTANMPIQFEGQRKKLSIHYYPEYTTGLTPIATCISETVSTLDDAINSAGAVADSPFYKTALTVPEMENIMMLYHRGITNIAESSLRPKLTNFARWLMSMPTPPEPRFGTTNRYFVQFGDGGWILDSIYGQLAEVLLATDTAIAKELKWHWGQTGKYMSAYFVPGMMTIRFDENWTSNAPVSAHFSGYWSSLHTRTVTPRYESALWMINGTWLGDHITSGSAGVPSFYLMGAPVGVIRNPYTTDANGGFGVAGTMIYSGLAPTNAVTVSGTNTFSVTTGESRSWENSQTSTVFAAFSNSGIMDCKQTRSNDIYYLTAALISPSPTFDVALIDHRFTNRLDVRYITQSLNVTGALTGALTTEPYDELYPTLPSIGTTNFVGPGLTTFGLTNATWLNHPSTGITVQVGYHLKDASNAIHATYFGTSLTPRERNLELRAVCSNDLNYVVVGRLRDAPACTITTNADTGAFYIVNGREELRASTNTWEYALGTQTNSAACFQGTAHLVATNGIGISGGPAELALTRAANTNFTISLSGPTGVRTITNASLAYPLVCAASGANITRYASR